MQRLLTVRVCKERQTSNFSETDKMLCVHLLASAEVTSLRARILSCGDPNLKIKLSQILKFKLMFNACEKVAAKSIWKALQQHEGYFFLI